MFVHSFVWQTVTTVSPEGFSKLDETYREYALAPINHLIRFWRLEVKVTAGH